MKFLCFETVDLKWMEDRGLNFVLDFKFATVEELKVSKSFIHWISTKLKLLEINNNESSNYKFSPINNPRLCFKIFHLSTHKIYRFIKSFNWIQKRLTLNFKISAQTFFMNMKLGVQISQNIFYSISLNSRIFFRWS